MSRSKPKIICECGDSIACNTILSHINGRYCRASTVFKETCRKLVTLKRESTRAWLKAEGAEASSSPSWWMSVLRKETSIEDWVFKSPRDPYCVKPSSAMRYSEVRKGSGNPAVKAHMPTFDKEAALDFGRALLSSYELFPGISKWHKELDAKFPSYILLFADKEKNQRRPKNILQICTGMNDIELERFLIASRGRHIAIGQKNSPTFKKIASETASKAVSKWRVSRPQRVLHTMIRSLDTNTVMEYHIETADSFVSYDIYSPMLVALIEMHGQIWHKENPNKSANEWLTKIVANNLENDKRKQRIAAELGFRYVVFWDSEMRQWEDQIFSLYKTKALISLEEAKDIICQEERDRSSLRHGDANKLELSLRQWRRRS